MASFLGPILATALAAQVQAPTLHGKVVDEQGKPVGNAQVVANAPYSRFFVGSGEPIEIETRSGADGQFRVSLPAKMRGARDRVFVWAYHPGLAIAVVRPLDPTPSLSLTLLKPQPKTIKLEAPDGKPISGAIVAPRIFLGPVATGLAELPARLSSLLAKEAGADGQVVIEYLSAKDALEAARVTAPAIGTQDLQLLDFRRRGIQHVNVTLRLKPTSNLAGHVRDSKGKPVAGQVVEVWSKGLAFQSPSPVQPQNGPLHTAADGSFRTPDNLMVGSQYSLAIRAPGMEPVVSKWMTIDERPRVLLPFILRPLRTISGRVVDRQGKPVADVEVFQSGDGPKRTEIRSDANGRFTLGGFPPGPVVVFARAPDFRFFGRLIQPHEHEVQVELIRRSERPAGAMRMLGDPIPLEESRALAKRLIEPYWNAALAQKNQKDVSDALGYLAPADPDGVLEKLEKEAENLTPQSVSLVKRKVALALVRTDPARALKLGETSDEPHYGPPISLLVADALPAEKRAEKVALLDRAVSQARTAGSPYRLADVAECIFELGEKDKAKALFAEARRMNPDPIPYIRGRFAARLARSDLPAALGVANEARGLQPRAMAVLYENIAFRLAAENPAEAERVLQLVPPARGRHRFAPSIVWKLATADPARAKRLAEEAQKDEDDPDMLLFLALGLKQRDPAAAERVFWKAIDGIDQRLKEGVEYSNVNRTRWILLPLVERIDPALVPELFWRAVALRLPPGDPRQDVDITPAELGLILGWYDRDVSSLVFEPLRARIEAMADAELDNWTIAFMSWSIFDPRAAAERLERASAAAGPQKGPSHASQVTGELLGLPFEDRWQKIWWDYTAVRYLLERDIL
jgi:hypothetical protein